MRQSSTVFLRLVVSVFALAILGLCVFGLPAAIRSEKTGMYRPILLGMYIPALPFFYGIYQTFKLLNYIDKNKAFSQRSVEALRAIKYCGSIISGLYALALPYIYIVAEKDDAPGVIVIGLVLAGAPLVIAVFAAVLQKLLQNAIDIKKENDLTV